MENIVIYGFLSLFVLPIALVISESFAVSLIATVAAFAGFLIHHDWVATKNHRAAKEEASRKKAEEEEWAKMRAIERQREKEARDKFEATERQKRDEHMRLKTEQEKAKLLGRSSDDAAKAALSDF